MPKTLKISGHNIASKKIEVLEVELLEVTGEDLDVFDGYHTLREVYDHRMAIFSALLRVVSFNTKSIDPCWKSKHHSDCAGIGNPCCSMFEGFFVAGIGYKPGTQITYHLPLKMWDDVKVPPLVKAPPYDGHTSDDVLERLKTL